MQTSSLRPIEEKNSEEKDNRLWPPAFLTSLLCASLWRARSRDSDLSHFFQLKNKFLFSNIQKYATNKKLKEIKNTLSIPIKTKKKKKENECEEYSLFIK